MIWTILQQIGFCIFLVLSIFFVVKKQHENLLVLYFFGATFNVCYAFFITIWSPVKIVSIAMGYCYFNQQKSSRLNPKVRHLIFFMIIMLIVSDLVAIITPPEYNQNILDPLNRLLMGNIGYIIAIMVLLFSSMLKDGAIERMYPKYRLAVEIAIIFGFLHYVCNRLGIEFMPILRQGGGENSSGSVLAEVGGQFVQRVYGVSGEPKNLGFLIVPYLVSSIIEYFRGWLNGWYKKAMVILGLFVLIKTYSSSALIEFALVVPFAIKFSRVKLSSGMLIAIMISLTFFLVYNIPHSNENGTLSALYERSFGRGAHELEEGRQETDVIDAFIKSGEITHLFGWGAYQYTFHAPNQLTIYGGLKPLQSGFVSSFVEFGLLGFICLCYCFALIIRLLLRSRQNAVCLSFALIVLSSFIGSLMYGNFSTCFIFLMMAIKASEEKTYCYTV